MEAAAEGPREAEAAMEELSDEQMKEAEQEVIRRQIEATEAQLETLEGMEGEEGDMLDEATMQALKVTSLLKFKNEPARDEPPALILSLPSK